MLRSILPLALATTTLLGALAAQGPDQTWVVPGTRTVVGTVELDGTNFSMVSRDSGKTWTRQNEVETDLHIRFGTFDPKTAPAIPRGLTAPASSRLFLVGFHTQIIREFRAALIGLGAEIHNYLPSQSYLVRMDAAVAKQVTELPFVRSLLPYHLAFRLEPEIIVALQEPTTAKSRYVIVLVDKQRDALGLEAQVRALGGATNTAANGGILFEATMTRQQLLDVVADDRTLYIERATPIEFDVDNARLQGGSDFIENLAGIKGEGMTGHVSEGVHGTHTEFAAITGVRGAPVILFRGTPSSHGTNTAGIIYARGVSALYKGLMPNARITYTDSGYAGANRYAMTRSMQQTNRVMLDTASWGYTRTLLYTARSAEMDDIIHDLDIFITQSQSNAGATSQPRNSRPQAWAKNICSVGGFYHFNNSSASDDRWGRGGSTGPASDGRIGVTLSAYYDSIRTTSGSTSYSTSFGGTSGATPVINGLSGNMIEMFTDGMFGYPKAAGKKAKYRVTVLPHFSTTKALLVATATQLTYNSSGVSAGANRYQQGFGFPNLRRAYNQRHRMLVIDELDVLRQGESRAYFVFARGGRLAVALQYPDPEAAALATIHRINSVDLRVKTSDGKSYWGNNGLLTGANSTAGGSANDRDTEESVLLANAPRGLTEILVRATAVRRDGHVETGANDIDYGLVAQGLDGLRDTSRLALDLDSTGPGNLTAKLGNVPATGWTIGFTLFSLNATRPLASGNVLGLEFDGLSASLLGSTPTAGSVFAFTSTGSASQYPNATYTFAPAIALAVQGRTLDGVVFLLNGGTVVDASNVDRVTVK